MLKNGNFEQMALKVCEYLYWSMPIGGIEIFDWSRNLSLRDFAESASNLPFSGQSRRGAWSVGIKAFKEDLLCLDEEEWLDLLEFLEKEVEYIGTLANIHDGSRVFGLTPEGFAALYPNRYKGLKIYLAGQNQKHKTDLANYLASALEIPYVSRVDYRELYNSTIVDSLDTKLKDVYDYYNLILQETQDKVCSYDSFVMNTSPWDLAVDYYTIFGGILPKQELEDFALRCQKLAMAGSLCFYTNEDDFYPREDEDIKPMKDYLYPFISKDRGLFNKCWLNPADNPIKSYMPSQGLGLNTIEGFMIIIKPDNRMSSLVAKRFRGEGGIQSQVRGAAMALIQALQEPVNS